jgi:hypothetical protein
LSASCRVTSSATRCTAHCKPSSQHSTALNSIGIALKCNGTASHSMRTASQIMKNHHTSCV